MLRHRKCIHQAKRTIVDGETISDLSIEFILICSDWCYFATWLGLPTQFEIFAKNLLRASRRRNIFLYFVLSKMSDLGFEPWPHF